MSNTNASVYRAKPRDISVSEVKLWAKTLFGNVTVYEPQIKKTKQEILNEIDYINDKIANKDILLNEINGDVQSLDSYIDYLNNMVCILEKDYKSAPETYLKKESDWTFHPYSYYDMSSALWEGNDHYANLDKTPKNYKLSAALMDTKGSLELLIERKKII